MAEHTHLKIYNGITVRVSISGGKGQDSYLRYHITIASEVSLDHSTTSYPLTRWAKRLDR